MISGAKLHFLERAKVEFHLLAEQVLGTKRFSKYLGRQKNKLLNHIETRLKSESPPPIELLERRTDLSPKEFHEEYYRKSKPVVFSQAAAHWPCTKKWDLDYFSLTQGQNDVLLVDSQGLTTREAKTDFEILKVRDLIKDIRAGSDKYLRFSPLLHENPHLANDLDLNWLGQMRGQKTFGNTYYMFMGGKGHKTYLHADQPCNLFVQIYGEKKWTLFMPEDSACLYPEVTNTAYVKSPVDLDRPDHQKFPLLKYARKIEVILKAGDVLYVPPHVWHQVENLTDTIAVGYRFSSAKAALRSSITFSLIRILSTNPPVWKTRAYGKIDTNLIWAHANGKVDQVLAQKQERYESPRA